MRKKNKSFVEIKPKNSNIDDNVENIINPLKKYEYVEKKITIKKYINCNFYNNGVIINYFFIKINRC